MAHWLPLGFAPKNQMFSDDAKPDLPASGELSGEHRAWMQVECLSKPEADLDLARIQDAAPLGKRRSFPAGVVAAVGDERERLA